MPIADYLNDALMGHIFLAEPYTAPAAVYLALYTDSPTEVGGGTEVSGGSYARAQATMVRSAGDAGVVENNAAITIPSMPACTVVAVGLMDASVAGNLLAYTILPVSVTYADGDNATAAVGALTFTIT